MTIPRAEFTAPRTVNVSFVNPAPGGGESNALVFTINNPVPAISRLSPNQVAAGSPARTVLILGSNFVNGCQVKVRGVAQETSFLSSAKLRIVLSAEQLVQPGLLGITVTNPDGQTSGTANMTVYSPYPTLTAISPSTLFTNSPNTTITVTGTGFITGSKVYLDATAVTTTYVSPTQLTAVVPATRLTRATEFDVFVENPTPGGGTSESVTLTVVNPRPAITGLSPTSVRRGTASLTLTINGTGFVSGAVVTFNGTALTTTFRSATQLTATVPGSLLTTAGSVNVVVKSPAPGGGDSDPAVFTITP